jgi:hypothetical protein
MGLRHGTAQQQRIASQPTVQQSHSGSKCVFSSPRALRS